MRQVDVVELHHGSTGSDHVSQSPTIAIPEVAAVQQIDLKAPRCLVLQARLQECGAPWQVVGIGHDRELHCVRGTPVSRESETKAGWIRV